MHAIYLQVKEAYTALKKLKLLGQVHKPLWVHQREEDCDEVEEEEKENIKDETSNKSKLCDKLANDWNQMSESVPYFIENEFEMFEFVKFKGKSLPSDPKQLLKLCTPSPFGDLKNCKTTHDISVRNAHQISEELSLTDDAIKYLDRAAIHISKLLFNDRKISFKMNKLNVYAKNGHFNEHKDTPKPNVIGSLIVELPYEYSGGEFKIRFDDADKKGVSLSALYGGGYMRMFAFYCECVHSIEKVKSGTRVTLSFYILDESNESKESKDSKDSTSISRKRKLSTNSDESSSKQTKRAKLDEKSDSDDSDDSEKSDNDSEDCEKELKWEINGTTRNLINSKQTKTMTSIIATIENSLDNGVPSLGLFLSNKYSNQQFKTEQLRGIDLQFITTLKANSKFKVTILPVMIYHSETISYTDYKEGDSRSMNVYRFTEDDIKRIADGGDCNMKSLKENKEKMTTFFGNNQWLILDSDEQSGNEYTGNESEDSTIDNHYFTNAVIIERA